MSFNFRKDSYFFVLAVSTCVAHGQVSEQIDDMAGAYTNGGIDDQTSYANTVTSS